MANKSQRCRRKQPHVDFNQNTKGKTHHRWQFCLPLETAVQDVARENSNENPAFCCEWNSADTFTVAFWHSANRGGWRKNHMVSTVLLEQSVFLNKKEVQQGHCSNWIEIRPLACWVKRKTCEHSCQWEWEIKFPPVQQRKTKRKMQLTETNCVHLDAGCSCYCMQNKLLNCLVFSYHEQISLSCAPRSADSQNRRNLGCSPHSLLSSKEDQWELAFCLNGTRVLFCDFSHMSMNRTWRFKMFDNKLISGVPVLGNCIPIKAKDIWKHGACFLFLLCGRGVAFQLAFSFMDHWADMLQNSCSLKCDSLWNANHAAQGTATIVPCHWLATRVPSVSK